MKINWEGYPLKSQSPSTDERNIFLSVCPSHSSGRVRLQAGVGGGTGRLSGYNYLVSSANYTPSITTALYHGPTTYTFLHIPLIWPVRLPGVWTKMRVFHLRWNIEMELKGVATLIQCSVTILNSIFKTDFFNLPLNITRLTMYCLPFMMNNSSRRSVSFRPSVLLNITFPRLLAKNIISYSRWDCPENLKCK